MAATTIKGQMNLFKHKLNGPVKKPLLPSATMKVVDTSDVDKSVPLLASHIIDNGDDNLSILACYGSWLRLRFEKFAVSSLDLQTIVKREYFAQSKSGKKNKQRSILEKDIVEIPSTVKHLQPGSESLTAGVTDSKAKKRKKNEDLAGQEGPPDDDGELPMEERLTNLTIDTPASSSVPSSNNLANLLSQVCRNATLI